MGGRGKKRLVFLCLARLVKRVVLISICFYFICLHYTLYGPQTSSRVQMTEDELILHFFEFDGNISLLLFINLTDIFWFFTCNSIQAGSVLPVLYS